MRSDALHIETGAANLGPRPGRAFPLDMTKDTAWREERQSR